MNEEYLCNTCRIGTVRPIHFSLNEAIIDCDNPSCESYLERWPDHCTISRPILNSTDLSKYERESTCSDSSGVHSDIGSSGLSQCSTDREVANFLYRSFSGNFDSQSYFTKDLSSRSFLQWPFGLDSQNQEPFVALDNNFSSPHEMSIPEKKIALENGLEDIICNEAGNHGDDVKNFDFFEMLKDDDHKALAENPGNSNTQLNISNDLESWLNGLDSNTLLEHKGDDFAKSTKNLTNGEFSSPSPSKPLRRSVHSAFSEVSPIKSSAKFHGQSSVENIVRDENKSFVIPNIFMSPATSDFNEDFSFNGDVSISNKSLTDSISPLKKNISDQTLFDDNKTNIEATNQKKFESSNITHFEPATLLNDGNQSYEAGFCKTENIFKVISSETSESLDCEDTSASAEVESNLKSENNTDSKIPACDILSFELPYHKIIEESSHKLIEDEISNQIKPNSVGVATSFDSPDDTFQGGDLNDFQVQPCDTYASSRSLSIFENADSQVPHQEEFKSNVTVKDIKSTSVSSPHFNSKEQESPLEKIAQLRITPQITEHLNIRTQKLQPAAVRRKCRNQTRIKSDVAVDPWSVPEVYIDELNIEVVLSDSSSSGRRSNLKSPRDANGVLVSSRNSVDRGTSFVHSPPRAPVQSEPVFEESAIDETSYLLPQKLDIYKPIIMKPVVVESEEVCYLDSPLDISPSKLRRSVGYRGLDLKNGAIASDSNSESNDDFIKSTYFSSVLSNIDFDENFCKQENEGPLEEALSINYLDFGSPSPEKSPSPKRGSPSPEKSPSPKRGSPKHGIKLKYENESIANCEERNVEDMDESKGEDSDAEIPVVTVDFDANDDLEIFMPVKKELKEQTEKISNKNLLNISVDYSFKRNRKKRRRLDWPLEIFGATPSNKATNPSNRATNSVAPKFGATESNTNYDYAASKSSHYNVHREYFTMFNLQDNFGNIKKEPENFDNLSDGLDCNDRFDGLKDTCMDLFGIRDDVIIKEEHPSPPKKVKKKNKWSYMDSSKESIVKEDIGGFDTKWAKPYINLPSKRLKNLYSKGNTRRNKLSNTIQFLKENPSEPEILTFLRDLGWAVTPYDPTVNSNAPEHAPSIVPSALQRQYGDMGSDFVYWSLTDKDVALADQRPAKKDASTNCTKIPKKKKTFDEDIRKKLSNHHSKTADEDILGEEEIKNAVNSKCLKSFKTKEGVTFFMPTNTTEFVSNEEEERRASDNEITDVDECIELPDDLLAYEEAKKSGFDVAAPPTLPKCIYIPPPSPRKPKPQPVLLPRPPVSSFLAPPPMEESTLKAQNELKAIVSERSAKDVPDVVCVTVDGKLYVYHRKDS